MSDSDSGVVHAFDQTNGVIAATGEERDGALSGTTSVDTEDVTGSSVALSSSGVTPATAAQEDDDAGDAAPDTAAAAEPQPETLDAGPDDDAGSDDAPTSDLPLPGQADAADDGEEHTYAVDSAGEATDEGLTAASDGGAYSEAPAVAEWSAADDGRDETSTRAESSAEPVDDASHTGRLADAYATGPADEVGGQESEPVETEPVDEIVVVEEGVVVVEDDPDVDPGPADTDSDATAATDGPAADTEAVQQTQVVQTAGDDAATEDDAPHSLAALVDDGDGSVHAFDQTNGVVDGLDGTGDGMTEDPGVSRTE